MVHFPIKQPKIVIPNNKPFSIDYKGAKVTLEQEYFYQGGDIYIHIPAIISRRGDNIGDDLVVLEEHFQKNLSHLNWDDLDADNIIICDIKQDEDTGIYSVVPNLTKTRIVQEKYRIESFDLSDMCFQYADSYKALEDDRINFKYVRRMTFKSINNWLSGDYYQVIPTCEKWEHLRSYSGENIADAVFWLQSQVEEPPKHINLDNHLHLFEKSMSRNSSSIPVDMQERLRKLQTDYVVEHNCFVDRWLKM
jgi:hypothetical protein